MVIAIRSVSLNAGLSVQTAYRRSLCGEPVLDPLSCILCS